MPETIRVQTTFRVRLYPMRTVIRIRLLGGALLAGGLALVAVAFFQPAPALERTRHDAGQFAGLEWLQPEYGERRLGLRISGTTYIFHASAAAMDSLARIVQPGESLEVWSTSLPLDRREVWQLSRDGRPLVSYASAQKQRADEAYRTFLLGQAFLALGAVCLGAAWLLGRFLRTAAVRAGVTNQVIRTGKKVFPSGELKGRRSEFARPYPGWSNRFVIGDPPVEVSPDVPGGRPTRAASAKHQAR
jgi:hypothetical protein